MNDDSCVPREGGIDAGPISTNGTFGRGCATCTGKTSAGRCAGAIAGSGAGSRAAGGSAATGGSERGTPPTGRVNRTVSALSGGRRVVRRGIIAPSSASIISAALCQRISGFFSMATAIASPSESGTSSRKSRTSGQLLVPLVIQHRVEAFALPRPVTGEHLPRDETEAVDVAARVERRALDLLRRHVRRRADRDAGHRELRIAGHRAREPEVGQQRTVVGVDEDVFRFHVAVHDTHRVRRAERARDVAREPLGALRLEAPVLADQLLERAPGHVRHDERESGVAQLQHVAHAHDVRVNEPLEESRLAREAADRFLVAEILRANELDRDFVA